MKKDFILPDIGEGIVECEIVEWLVNVGDVVKEDEPVCDVMTDKALVQIPSMHSGVITALYYKKGDIAKVHAPLFEMSLAGSTDAITAEKETTHIAAPSVQGQSNNDTEDFILPDIGEGIVECEIVDWLVAEGQEISEDQPVCDVMTDKALVQIPAKYSGKVTKLYYKKGDIAKVHSPLFAMTHNDANASNAAVADVSAHKHTPAPVVAVKSCQSNANERINTKALASPAVRRLARELDVDIQKVAGSGEKGRVYKDDVRAYANGLAGKSDTSVSTSLAAPKASVQVAGNKRVEAIKGMKAAMARQMADSVSIIPHFTYCEEIDLTELIALRLAIKNDYEKQGVKVTLMPFFMKALSLALNQFPILNSQVNSDCTELTYFDDHNIGFAVDSKIGLLVPNIKGCQQKSIIDIAKALNDMTALAREARVSPADLKGGTITISNIGAIGGTVATPIINKPEVAIVALGKVQTLPRFNDKGEVVARQIMQISWSGDHRVIDGGTIARFTNLWRQYLEQPATMMMVMQ